jgi:hypothetical protein
MISRIVIVIKIKIRYSFKELKIIDEDEMNLLTEAEALGEAKQAMRSADTTERNSIGHL